jgi:anti-sigma factor RsiW
MEADGVNLSDDEVRERFSAYHDGELPAAEAAFVKKRLGEDAKLKAEYELFRKMLGGLASLSLDTNEDIRAAETGAKPGAPSATAATAGASGAGAGADAGAGTGAGRVDLLAGVQARLNKRSGGKFYRNRWTRRAGIVPLEAIAAVVLILLVLVYVAMTYISELRSAGEPAGRGNATQQQQR